MDPNYVPRNKTLPRDPNTLNLRLLKPASYRNYEHVPTLSELFDQPRRKWWWQFWLPRNETTDNG